MSHKPNPFDFVPFVESGPNLYPLKDFVESNNLKTGYLTVCIKALTPVHIVGDQEAVASDPKNKSKKISKKDYRITSSSFCRRKGIAFIPSSTIRGCLRSFIEAATNGWVSQFTPNYEKERKKHKYGFKVDGTITGLNPRLFDTQIPSALNEQYILPHEVSDAIDVSSFLFGYTPENGKARQGRVVIEDAPINNAGIDEDKTSQVPDILHSAFMGGPHPSASSWWYQYPYQIRLSNVGVDFIGSGYRGRKFYFHQNPEDCVKLYPVDEDFLNSSTEHPVYPIPIECLKSESATDDFRIYFEEIPEPLLKILILALTPGSSRTECGRPTLRHKLGYGKAYGYGAIEFIITGGKIRRSSGSPEVEYIKRLQNEVISSLWDFNKFKAIGIENYLHKESLEGLARILWFDPSESTLFQYPPFDYGGFLPGITKSQLKAVMDKISFEHLEKDKMILVTRVVGKNLARKLYQTGFRKALHFKVYQESSDNYQKIQQRNLYNCQ